MPDQIEFPDEWLSELHPRRGGRRDWAYAIDDALVDTVAQWRAAKAQEIDEVLAHPDSDPELVAQARSGAATIEAVAAQLALETQLMWQASHVARAEERVRQLGLVDAAAAYVRSCGAAVIYAHRFGGSERRGMVLTSAESAIERQESLYLRPTVADMAYFRHLLVRADDTTRHAAAERLTPYRAMSWQQRVLTTYLLPHRHDWVEADYVELPASEPYENHRMLLYSAFRPEHVVGLVAGDLGTLVTVIDELGYDAVPFLVASLDWHIDRDPRDTVLGALEHLNGAEVQTALLRRARLGDAAETFERCAAREPETAAAVLIANPALPYADVLLTRHLHRFPTLPAARSRRRPPTVLAEELPASLARAPKAAKAPPKLPLPDPGPRVTIDWLPGERDEWHWDMWPTFDDPTHYDDELGSERARFYLGGSEGAVRPKLFTWAAETSSFYLENPKLLVAKYELDAYRPALRLARAKPSLGAALLAPYVSADVAELMAKWLVGSHRFRPLARDWFGRHGKDAVALLLPAAFAGKGAASRTAVRALAMLDTDTVRAAADELGCRDAVDEHVLSEAGLLPARVPALPSWLDPAALPPVLTRDRRHALDDAAAGVLCRLLASSRPDDRHPGLDDALAALDPSSVASFGWQLYGSWHLAGRPSRDAWALDALGLVGDDDIADRLAPLVRQWPSDGAAGRAKRGAEALAAMPGETALLRLSELARNAKSTPLRTHCLQLLDGVAAERGLLPEQLADLLAPSVGLGDVLQFRGETLRIGLGPALDLVLIDASDGIRPSLPKPVDDDEKAVVSAWRKQRRLAAPQVKAEVRRLEQAMIDQRQWHRNEFASAILDHPLLGTLARRLVWTVDGTTVVVDAHGDLVDIDNGPVPDGEWVRLAHPATDDLTQWRVWRDRTAVQQPFEQLDRVVVDTDPSTWWGTTVSATALAGLARCGWHWGPTGQAARRTELFRPLASGSAVRLEVEPGVSAVDDLASQPEQTVTMLTLRSGQHRELAVFADLPRVTRSEIALELSHLTAD